MSLYFANSFDEIKIGGTYQGTITGVKDYGLFVRIDNCRTIGLAHVSKIEHCHVNKSKYIQGAGVVVQVLDVNRAEKKVALQISDADQMLIRQGTPKTPMRITRAVGTQALNEKEANLFECWGLTDKQIIGYYHRDEAKGLYVVDDIRKTNFDPIPYYPNDELERPVKMYFDRELRGVRLNDYYVFTWKLSNRGGKNPYEIWIDHSFPIKPIDPKSFIETLFADRYNDKSKNFGSAANFIDTLSKQLTANDSTFVYELLQNANDYPQAGKTVDVVFEVTDSYLLFRHSGRVFDVRNISGICGINEREKTANKKAIGYKGIGFKTVFQIAHYVYIRTGVYSFRFEEKAKQIKRLRAPWPILPVWTTREEVADEVKQVFDAGAKDYPVQIALRPERKALLHEGKGSYESLLGELFADSNVILFVPNISSVRVIVGGREVRKCIKDKSRWQVDWLSKQLSLEFQASVNKTVDAGKSRIPEKYKDFAETQVAFACHCNGNVIEPLANANLYCYLPTSASWGFSFLMNTDMIPKGDRNDIETEVKLLDENETNFNEELAAVAGGLFFEWIHALLHSGKYEFGSVYSLIPDFAKCVREHKNYEAFIARFQTDFESKLESEPIVVLEDGSLALIQNTVLDATGLMGAEILSDEEFYAFTEYLSHERLPAKCVRNGSQFNKFHKRYCNDRLVFSWESLHALIHAQGFRNWLKIQGNNDKFLKFLLDRGYFEDFLDEEIFIEEECGNLYKASDIYYDVDEELEDLRAFSCNIPRLSLKTREFFDADENWHEVCAGAFATFRAREFVEKVLLSETNWNETIRLLHDQKTSIHFYLFLAKKDLALSRLEDLPFFNADQSPVEAFKDRFVFFDSDVGRETCSAAWLSSVPFAFLSPLYGDRVNDYLAKNACVRVFSNEVIVGDIILDEDCCVKVNAAQQTSFEASKSFVDYCFEHRDCFSEGASLSGYALRVADVRGEQNWILPSDDHVYFASDAYSEVSGCEWLGADWMYCLDEGYVASAIPGLKDFIRERFDVEIFKIGTFFDDIVVREFAAIRKAVDTKEKSIAFHAFVIKNKDDLTAKQVEVMKGAPVYLYGQEEPSITSSGHRVLSSKARELQEEGLVEFSDLDIISPEYHSEDHADYWEDLLGNAKFTVVDFVNWTRENQNAFRERIKDLNLNVSFWRWLRDSEISDETIKALPVLPLCLKDGTWGETSEVVYLSDEYIQGGGVETLVKSFNPKAAFIGPEYLNDNEVESWKEFWIRIGLRFEILGILKDAIDNRLGEIQDAKLVSTLAKHRTDLEKSYGDELPARLADLKLQSRDGQFRSLNEIVYVDCEKSEPFPRVELPNQVSFATADERRLMTDVLNANGGSKIDSLQGWRRAKISRYLQIQEDASQIDLLRSIHYAFVEELAELFAQGLEELEFEGETDREKLELVRKVLFLDRKNQFVPAERLTEGSAYEPFCDFERFGLEYDYLSDSYKTSCASDVRRLLSRVFHVHCDFREGDIPQLENRGFAIYFWKDYLPTANFKSRIQGMIEERKFDSVACIPTKDHMKRPDEVYSPDKNMALYVKAIEDTENKVPLKDLPDVEYESGKTFFSLLLNKKENLQLSFLDALYALFRVVGQGSRSQLLEWMIDSYDPKYEENIRLYRADDGAKWKNTKNDDIHIAKLYALAYGNKLLEQYFGTLPQIINSDYLPSGENFAKACEILGVKVIGVRADDVIIEPQDACRIETNTSLKIKALALAYCVDAQHWQEKFNAFKYLIDAAKFYRCSSLSVRYRGDAAVCQDRKKFSRREGSSDFYFVDSLDDKRVFKQFVDSFVNYLGLKSGDLDSDLVETIMDSEESAEEWLDENNDLKLDDDFQREMEQLKPASRGRYVGKQADEEDVIDDGGRRVIPVQRDEPQPSPDDDECPSSDPQHDSGSDEEDLSSTEDEDSDDSTIDLPLKKGTGPICGSPSVQALEHEDLGLRETGHNDPVPMHNPTGHSSGGGARGPMNIGSKRPPSPPKPFSAEDVECLRPKGKPRSLAVLEPTQSEVSELNQILDGLLTSEQIADQNYLAQLRLYRNLVECDMRPEEPLDDFVRNGVTKEEHSLSDGKYIHKCSAAGGILYLSPAIWNKIASGKCVVCVYLGAKANDFMYFRSIQDILDWVQEDDIVIKLTGDEKARTVEALYSGVLEGVKGTAYTMLRIQSNERYDSLFAPLDPTVADSLQESEDEY